MQTKPPQKILIDTDIGDDIDDALALAYALRSPEVEVVALTTVFRHAARRADIARQLLDAFGKTEIPVAAGLDGSLLGKRRATLLELEQDEERPPAYGTGAPAQAHPPGEAVRLLYETAKAHPGQLTVVGIGALTNLAAALVRYPDLAGLLKRIVFMGGAFFTSGVEWNIACDPEAAHVVLESGVPLWAAGLEVTLPCQLNPAQTQTLENLPGEDGQHLSGLVRQWRESNGGALPILHDVVAVHMAFSREYLAFAPLAARVELSGEHMRGAIHNLTRTFWWKGENQRPVPNLIAGTSIDAQGLIRQFFQRLGG